MKGKPYSNFTYTKDSNS